MIDNVFIIKQHEQIRELSSELKFRMLEQLIHHPATCQQLADTLGVSKQKAHYNLKGLLDQGLIRSEQTSDNNKEKYYRACASNYVLDFSLGRNTEVGLQNHRDMLTAILEDNYGLDLADIAARLLTDCLRLHEGEKLLVTTGKYNMPLVEHLLNQAGMRNIETTLMYQHAELIDAKLNRYPLEALRSDYARFNALLEHHHVYMNLNGESRFITTSDPERLAIRRDAFAQSREIIARRGVRVAIMPGLLKETLQESDIVSEIRFWKAIDVDFAYLYATTDTIARILRQQSSFELREGDNTIAFNIARVMGEYGSFGDSPLQSPIINLPGGAVLVVPQSGSMNGTVTASSASAFGEQMRDLRLTIRDNRIVGYACDRQELIERAIREGGADGGVVALVTLNTNDHRGCGGVNAKLERVPSGAVSLYFGENVSMGGGVRGDVEWTVQLDSPEIFIH